MTRRLTLLHDDAASLSHCTFRDLEIGPDVELNLGDQPVQMHRVEVAGIVRGHLELTGGLVVRATGDVEGSVDSPSLVIEEGGGLRAALHITPPEPEGAGGGSGDEKS